MQPPQPASLSERSPFWLRFLPLLAALLLLASTPWSQLPRELWSDEAFTVTYTLHPDVGAVLEDVRKNEETPPLFFILEWAWASVAVRSEPLLRLPSMLFGVLAVVVYARAVQRWLSPGGAVIATATLALSPLVARYMVEARCYMLFLLCSVLCMVLFERIYHHPEDRRSLAAYALVAGALMLTFYFGVVMVAAHNLIWLTTLVWNRDGWRNRLRSWVLVQLCVITIVLPWLPSLFYQYAVASTTTNIPTINPMITLLFFLSTIFSYPPAPWLWEAWLLIAGLFWLVMVVGLLRMRESSAEGGLVLRMFAVPILMFLVLHLTTRANTPRLLLIVLPGAAISAAVGWGVLRKRYPRMGSVLAVVLVGGLVLYRVVRALATPSSNTFWAQTADVVAQRARPGDVVLLHPLWEQRTFAYYYHGPPIPLLGAHNYDDFYAVQRHRFQDSWTVEEAVKAVRGYRRVWLVHNPQRYHLQHPLHLPYPLLETWDTVEPALFLYELPELPTDTQR